MKYLTLIFFGCFSVSTSSCNYKSHLERVCGHEEQCGVDPDECQRIWGKMVITNACANAQVKTPCDDLFNTASEFWDICFPPCSPPGDSHCEGEILHKCEEQYPGEGSEFVIDCLKYCEIEGMEGGTCGETPSGYYEFGCICE